MESRGQVERDFLGMDTPTSNHHHQPRLDRRQSFRGISKINPEIVKSVMANAETTTPPSFVELPQLKQNRGIKGKHIETGETQEMTIFYNGTVSVFDLPRDKLESILKFATEKSSCVHENDNRVHETIILDSVIDGDLSLKRKKSLQRFFEKRKERLISVSPYTKQHVFARQFPHKTVLEL